MKRGINFCQVINIKALIQFKPDITFGNQKWHGAIPNLIISPKIRAILLKDSVNSSFGINFIMADSKIIPEPIACAKKYLIDDSDSWLLLVDIINGINDRRFNSKDIHNKSQWEADIAVIVLKISVDENSAK